MEKGAAQPDAMRCIRDEAIIKLQKIQRERLKEIENHQAAEDKQEIESIREQIEKM